jgi:tetratricopeptide (TPR) repeat protein
MWSLQRVRTANAEEARQRQVAEIQQQVLDQKATAYERNLPRLVHKMDELLVGAEATLDDATRGALNYELASVYSSLSDFSKAEAYGKAAMNLGDEAAQGRAKLLLSDIYTQRGDYAQAEQLLRTINTKSAGPRLALVLKYLERYDESEQLYLSQLDEFSAEPESKARVLNNLGSLYYEQGDYGAAIARLRQAFTIRESLLSAAENERARSRIEKQLMTTQSNLGGCLTMAGKLDEAEPLLTEVVTRARSTYPKGHDLLAHFLLYSGRLKVKQRRFAAAEVDLKEAYLINQRHFGSDHKWTREVVEWLIELYSSWGKPELATSYYKKSSSTISDEIPAAK